METDIPEPDQRTMSESNDSAVSPNQASLDEVAAAGEWFHAKKVRPIWAKQVRARGGLQVRKCSFSESAGEKMTWLKHRVLRITCASAVCTLLSGCGPESSQPNGQDSGPSSSAASNDQSAPRVDETNVAKVKVLGDGTILLDDKRVNIDGLKAAFTELKDKHGVVWYYRDNAAGEPPPEAMAVMEAVMDAKLPIKLSSKPDFSDSVGPGGN